MRHCVGNICRVQYPGYCLLLYFQLTPECFKLYLRHFLDFCFLIYEVESSFLQDSNLSNNRSLNRFIDENIQPDEIFLRHCGEVINTIYLHLQREFKRELPSSGSWWTPWTITGKKYTVNRMIKVLLCMRC